jgi:hypothetical protein
MNERIQYLKVAPGAYRAMAGLEHYLQEYGWKNRCFIW